MEEEEDGVVKFKWDEVMMEFPVQQGRDTAEAIDA